MTETASAPARANEIQLIRLYDAPVAMVWDAWTDLEQLAQWWGPRGFTITTKSKDLRPGGSWDYIMHGPDGKDWPNFARYHEVEHHKLLVYDHGATSTDAKPLFHVTARFRDVGGKTELDMRMMFASAEEAQQSRVFIKAAGGNSTWDRLAEYLEKEVTHKDVFVIARSFDASIETVYDMWTKPEHIAAWSAPTGFTMQFHDVDLRPGGHGFYSMTNGQFTMYGRAEYIEMRKPDRIQYTQQFTDEHGNMSRHPMAPTWPAKMLTTVQLASEGPSQTRVSLRWEVFGEATDEERATFAMAKAGMTQGWTGSFDNLEEQLAKRAAH